MAINRINFRSEQLGKMTAVNVYLPDVIPSKLPVIYLLHGFSDDCNTWLNATSLERYAGAYPFIIVMPQVELSYYTDMVYGERYWSYLTQELPQKMAQWFPIATEPERTFAAGLSMGGYGAFKWGLQEPERFRGVASLSGALDVLSLWQNDAAREARFSLIFGSKTQLAGSQNDLIHLVKQMKKPVSCQFYQICGTEDFLYTDNQHFRQYLEASEHFANYEYAEAPGAHEWGFWDTHIQGVLQRFKQLL